MLAEQLIVGIAALSPKLSSAGLRLVVELVARSIEQGSNDVCASMRSLARQMEMSREGTAMAVRDLGRFIAVQTQPGKDARFRLPPEWFSPQRPLFVVGGDRPILGNWPTNQATTGLETRPPLDQKPGHYWPGNQATRPTNQATTGLETRPHWPGNQADRPTNQASEPPEHIRNAHTRVDRSIDPDSATTKLILLIDRALRTVEIMDTQRQDAEILSETLQTYRNTLAPECGFNATPDEVVLARILAIASVEELCGVLRKLLYERVRPGRQDMWFFTVLMQKLHGASPKLTASRYDALKGKKPPMTETLPNFGPQLARSVAAGIHHF